MTIYSYTADTGEYIGSREAREDPKHPGRYLIPKNATDVPPPGEKEGYARCWDGEKWVYKEDHRGEEWYINGEPVTLKLGDKITTEMSRDKLASVRPEKLADELRERAQRMADRKTVAAKAYLAGKPYVSPEQQERYERKYDVAKAYLETKDDKLKALLAPEADGAGMSVDDLAALIVQMGDQWRQAVQAYAVMIDGARVVLNQLIDAGKLEGVQTALNKLGTLGADATPDEIKAILDEAKNYTKEQV